MSFGPIDAHIHRSVLGVAVGVEPLAAGLLLEEFRAIRETRIAEEPIVLEYFPNVSPLV
ncbi:hypothetical protein LV35_04124 [Acinetobacter baumannii]|uniref:Uncharacterized protein n=1 Tax=Acinetobacter baumannii TaxID=470 RepID=A0AAJ0QT82_ACIBA|nr:hypothetical protein LV35_04124 [Acinetobacter baumannii]